jgi:transposase
VEHGLEAVLAIVAERNLRGFLSSTCGLQPDRGHHPDVR